MQQYFGRWEQAGRDPRAIIIYTGRDLGEATEQTRCRIAAEPVPFTYALWRLRLSEPVCYAVMDRRPPYHEFKCSLRKWTAFDSHALESVGNEAALRIAEHWNHGK